MIMWENEWDRAIFTVVGFFQIEDIFCLKGKCCNRRVAHE